MNVNGGAGKVYNQKHFSLENEENGLMETLIPYEVLQIIIYNLDDKNFVNSRLVNRRWNSAYKDTGKIKIRKNQNATRIFLGLFKSSSELRSIFGQYLEERTFIKENFKQNAKDFEVLLPQLNWVDKRDFKSFSKNFLEKAAETEAKVEGLVSILENELGKHKNLVIFLEKFLDQVDNCQDYLKFLELEAKFNKHLQLAFYRSIKMLHFNDLDDLLKSLEETGESNNFYHLNPIIQTLHDITNPETSEKELNILVKKLMQDEQIDPSITIDITLKIIMKTKYSALREWGEYIAINKLNVGDVEKIVRIVNNIPTSGFRSLMIESIFDAYMKQRDLQRAVLLANMKPIETSSNAILTILDEGRKVKDFTVILKLMESIQDENIKKKVINGLANQLVSRSRIDEISALVKIAKGMEPQEDELISYVDSLLSSIALQFAEIENFSQARAFAKKIQSKKLKKTILAKVNLKSPPGRIKSVLAHLAGK